MRRHRRLLELSQCRAVPILVLRQRNQPVHRETELLRLRNTTGECLLVEAKNRELRGRVELRVALHADIRAHSHISERHDRVRQPRPPQRAAQLGVMSHRDREHAADPIRLPAGRPAAPPRIGACEDRMREVDDELGRLLLIHGTDRDRGRHAPIPPIPQRDARLRGMRLDLHRRFTRLALRDGHQGHAVGVRGEDRLPELQRDTVPGEHLIKLEGVI